MILLRYVYLENRFFLNVVNVFSLYCFYIPLEKGMTLHSKKPESLSPYNVYRNWPSTLGEENCKSHQCIFAIISPRKRRVALHLKKLGSPLLKNTLYQVLFNLAQWLRRRGWKYEKIDRQTDNGRQTIIQLTWACSFGVLKTVQKLQFTECFKLVVLFLACTFL